jgi:CheY-like chemotaxis protein
MKTLIADENRVTRLLLHSALARRGHEVHEATNGLEAWEAWRDGDFRLVIADWMMPNIDGLEICRWIRAEGRTGCTYFILLTSKVGTSNYLEAMDAGVDDFMTKPLERARFAAQVRVAERILGLDANLRATNSDLEQRVTERTAELEIALDVRNDFLSRASHELRTPLGHVLRFAQILEKHALTSRRSASVEQIITSGQHLLALIDRILAVSQSSSTDLSFLTKTRQRPKESF